MNGRELSAKYTCGEYQEVDVDLNLTKKKLCLDFLLLRAPGSEFDFDFKRLVHELKGTLVDHRTSERTSPEDAVLGSYCARYNKKYGIRTKEDEEGDVRISLFKRTNKLININDVFDIFNFYFIFKEPILRAVGVYDIGDFQNRFEDDFGYASFGSIYDDLHDSLKELRRTDLIIRSLDEKIESLQHDGIAYSVRLRDLISQKKDYVTHKNAVNTHIKDEWLNDLLKVKRNREAQEYKKQK
jgi:hypothetical protein